MRRKKSKEKKGGLKSEQAREELEAQGCEPGSKG